MARHAPFYVTTPIYYVNDVPHIGHTYTTIVADVAARYRRMLGRDVRFLTGTDEHGVNIQRASKKQGLRPIELADRVVARYHELWKQLSITHDDFIRTTQPRHHAAVEALFRKVRDAGDIYEGKYSGHYCASCESFYPEGQLVEGSCPVHERPTEWLEESSYFFRLSKYEKPLLELYESRPDFVLPEGRRNEIVSFVRSGLKDLSISRTSVRWGIPVPDDPQHVIYVWFDALTNYISALGYGSDDDSLYRKYWTDDGGPASAVHLVGKDILRFHAVYWPAFLMAAGEPLPDTVYAHGWWLADERKMSKTVGNVIRPGPLLEVFGTDALRYFLLREMTFGLDGTYSDDAIIERSNADLANNIGNLLSRVVTLIGKEPGGQVDRPADADVLPETRVLRESGRNAHLQFLEAFDGWNFSGGLAKLWGLLDDVNKFLVVHQPWKAADDAARAKARGVLYEAAASLRVAAACIAPVTPGLSSEIWRRLGLEGTPEQTSLPALEWDTQETFTVSKGEPLFRRIDRDRAVARLETLRAKDSSKTTPKERTAGMEPQDDQKISIDQFMNVELRVAKIESAERVPNADKLLKIVVDVGAEKRQIVAGIAESYAPEDLVGKQIIVVANLKSAVLRGVESQGMLLAADAEGRTTVATFEIPVPPGTRVR